jgi:CMP-N-acetylneuraminic acid synthetase
MSVYALLTGRGNNTLKNKNILSILKKPVLYYIANAAIKSCLIDDYYCSSDDEDILAAADELGYKRIKRPPELALPTSQHKECIIHALKVIQITNKLPDILIVLLANNVTCKSNWITDCIRIMQSDENITAVVPVYQDNDHHPLRAKTLNAHGSLEMYEKNITDIISTNRQDLPKCLFLSHNFWVLRTSYLLSGKDGQQPWGFMGDKIIPYEIDESIDIHKEIDLTIAADWIKRNYTD